MNKNKELQVKIQAIKEGINNNTNQKINENYNSRFSIKELS